LLRTKKIVLALIIAVVTMTMVASVTFTSSSAHAAIIGCIAMEEDNGVSGGHDTGHDRACENAHAVANSPHF
jgi:hypothetical protein